MAFQLAALRWPAVAILALRLVACQNEVETQTQPTRPFQTPFGREVADIRTVEDAVDALAETIQDVYVESGVTRRVGNLLLDQAMLAQSSYEAGNQAQSFAHLSGAHGLIESALSRGQVSTNEAAFRLHRSVDLIGAKMASIPP